MQPLDFTSWAWTHTNITDAPYDIDGTPLAPGESRTFRGSAADSPSGAEQFLDSFNHVVAQLPAGVWITDASMVAALEQAMEQAHAYDEDRKRVIAIPDAPSGFTPAAQDGPLAHVEEPQDLTGRGGRPRQNVTAEIGRAFGAPSSEPPPKEPLAGLKDLRSREEVAQGTTGADPVDLFSGEFFLEKVDFELPSVGFPFTFVRTYRSGRPYFGPFGYNWDHNYNIYLRELRGGRIAVHTGRLHEDLYADSGDSILYHSPRGVFAVLRRQAAGSAFAFVLTFRDGMTWNFARPAGWPHPERIPLVAIADRHGNTQRLEYDANLLVRITDTVGRAVDLVYGNCGRLEALRPAFLQKPGAPPLEIQYLHTADAERLYAMVTLPTPEFPAGLVTEYEYDEAQPFGELRNNITRVVDHQGHTVVENIYGHDPADPGFNRIVKQYFDGGEYLFRYTPLKFTPPYDDHVNDASMQVELYEPERSLKLYTFNFRGNLLDQRFRLCADGTYRVCARAYRYTKDGQLAERYHPDGMAEFFTYDQSNPDPLARGLLLRVDLKSQPNRLSTRALWRFSYEPRYGRVKTITDEVGQVTTFVYDYELDPLAARGNLARIEYPDTILPDGTAQTACHTTFHYDDRGQVLEQVSPEGRRTVFEYYLAGAGAGLPKSVTRYDAGQPIVERFEYDALGYPARHVDGREADTLLAHNLLGQLTEVQLRALEGRRARFRYEYNADRQVAREYVPRGAYDDGVIGDEWIVHEYEYDVASRLREVTRFANTAAPQVTRIGRDVNGDLRQITDPLGRQTTFRYDERGLLLAERRYANDPSPQETVLAYDRSGRLTAVRHPDGSAEQFDFTETFGRLAAETNRFGVRREFSYGPRDELLRTLLKDAAGGVLHTAQYTYDERGRLVGYDLNGLAQTFYYDKDDLLDRALDHRNREVRYTYDGLGRVSSIADPLGTVARLVLDANGNRVAGRIEYQSAAGAATSFEERTTFDARDRLISATDRFGNQVRMIYDDRDLGIETIDTLGNCVRTEYEALGLPTRTALVAGGGETTIRRWQRDLLGQPLTFEDADGNVTSYAYDSRDNLVCVTYPDGSTVRKSYDALNRLAAEVDPNGSTLTYAYDALGRLTDVTAQPGAGVAPTAALHFSYDAFGRLRRIEDGAHPVERTYDFLNRVTQEQQGPYLVRHVFDDAADRATLVYSDGREDVLELDELGRVARVVLHKAGAGDLVGAEFPEGTPLAHYTYDGILLASCRLANGVVTRYHYDQDAKLTGRDVAEPAGVLLDSQRRLFDGEKRARLDVRGPAISRHTIYHYDALSRLTTALTSPGGVTMPDAIAAGGTDQATIDGFLLGINTANAPRQEQFDLVVNDRRLSWRRDSVTFTPTYNNLLQITQLTASSGAAAALYYDANGNRTEDGRLRYTYDAFDRLVTVRDKASGQTLLELVYDALGRVVVRREGGVATRLVYDGPRAIEELRGSARVQRCFGAGVDELLVESGAANLFCHQDEIGSLIGVTDGRGAALQFFEYSAFGLPARLDPGGTSLPVDAEPAPLFGGRPYHAVTGLYDLRARWYDPATGTFLQRDAEHYAASANPYLYCQHNPVGLADPNGRIVPIIVGIAAAAALGAGSGALLGSIRQGLQIASGYTDEYGNVKQEFDWNELGTAVGIGGLLGFGVFLFPPLAGGMIAVGVAGGVTEVSNGNRLVGAFDVGTSIFGAKGLSKFSGTTVASRFNRLGNDTLISLKGVRLQTNLSFIRMFGFTRSGFHQRRLESAFSVLTRTPELRVAMERVADPTLRVNEEFVWGPGSPRAGKTAGERDVFTRTEIDEVKTGVDFMRGLTPSTRKREFLHEPSEVRVPGQLDRYRMFFPSHRIHLWIRFQYFTHPRTGEQILHKKFKAKLEQLEKDYPDLQIHELTPEHMAPPRPADFSSPLSPLALPPPRPPEGSSDSLKSPVQKT
jgi:RHS repeat-associated protein